MKNLVGRNILRFLLLMAIQMFVLNNIALGGYITPFLFVTFILMLPTYMDKRLLLLVACLSGLCVDVFCNMMGFHAFCCTFVAMLRILFANKILTRNDPVEYDCPSIRTVSWQQYSFYSLLLLFVYSLTYFMLVIFSFREMGKVLLSALLSTVVAWGLSILYQVLFLKPNKTS